MIAVWVFAALEYVVLLLFVLRLGTVARELSAAHSRIRDLEKLADTLQTGIALGGRMGGKP